MAEEKQDNDFIPHLKAMLSNIKFGSITLIVQDGKVIQLEKNEKLRIK